MLVTKEHKEVTKDDMVMLPSLQLIALMSLIIAEKEKEFNKIEMKSNLAEYAILDKWKNKETDIENIIIKMQS